MVLDPEEQRSRLEASMAKLLTAHAQVGGDLVSAGGTGTHRRNEWATEIQAGSYVLMDRDYQRHPDGFAQALFVEATVIARTPKWAVADCGLKAFGMDKGNPSIDGATVHFLSDEHLTFSPDPDGPLAEVRVGDRIRVVPVHIDPTVAYHEAMWLVDGDRFLERWPIDLRGW
jgi:D-threonine aldolase